VEKFFHESLSLEKLEVKLIDINEIYDEKICTWNFIGCHVSRKDEFVIVSVVKTSNCTTVCLKTDKKHSEEFYRSRRNQKNEYSPKNRKLSKSDKLNYAVQNGNFPEDIRQTRRIYKLSITSEIRDPLFLLVSACNFQICFCNAVDALKMGIPWEKM